MAGGSDGTDTDADPSTVRVQLIKERVLVVFVHALTVKVRSTVTTLGVNGVGGAEADAVTFPTVTVLVTVTILVVVDVGSTCWSSMASCSLIFWTRAVGSAAHTPIVTSSLVSPETIVGSQLLHPMGCSTLGFSLVGVSATVSATGRGLATTYEANATRASLTKAMLILVRLWILGLNNAAFLIFEFCHHGARGGTSLFLYTMSFPAPSSTPFSGHVGNIKS